MLFKVSPGDGVKTVLSDFADGKQGTPGVRPSDVAVERTRRILVVDADAGTNARGSLSRIDPATGLRTPIHDFGNPDQASPGTPLGLNPVGLAVESTGDILVVDAGVSTGGQGGEGRLFRVNPSTNFRTILNDFGKASEGPRYVTPSTWRWSRPGGSWCSINLAGPTNEAHCSGSTPRRGSGR